MVNKIKAIEIKDYIGKKFYTSWYQVSQEAINKFADLTKDHQYIHIKIFGEFARIKLIVCILEQNQVLFQ